MFVFEKWCVYVGVGMSGCVGGCVLDQRERVKVREIVSECKNNVRTEKSFLFIPNLLTTLKSPAR